MKNKPYVVRGDKEKGHRIAVPESTGLQAGDEFDCTIVPNREGVFLTAGPGSLVYVPHVDDNAGTGGSGKKKVRK